MKVKEFLDVFDSGVCVNLQKINGESLVTYTTKDENTEEVKKYYDFEIVYAQLPPTYFDLIVVVKESE